LHDSPAQGSICQVNLTSNQEGIAMPTISMFYGIIIRMLFLDTKQHNLPHIHVEYQGQKAVFIIPSGELLEGNLPIKKIRQVQVWIDLHEEELMADWTLAVNGEAIFRIDPLH
jgi:hypothetical protein